LSLNYLQLQAAEAKPYKDDWPRRRNSRRRGTRTSYDGNDSMLEERSLSKNDINAIRRSQVGPLNQFSHLFLYLMMFIVAIGFILLHNLLKMGYRGGFYMSDNHHGY
jgi:hypothetical protein